MLKHVQVESHVGVFCSTYRYWLLTPSQAGWLAFGFMKDTPRNAKEKWLCSKVLAFVGKNHHGFLLQLSENLNLNLCLI